MGGPGGFGRGGDWGSWWERYREQRKREEAKRTKEEAEAKLKERVSALLSEGWSNLKAGDSKAAIAVFFDVLELKPTETEARLGLGLSRAANGEYTIAIKQLEMAVKADTTKRLGSYNLAVVYTRINQKPRSAVILNTYLTGANKIPDQMVLNAQRSLINGQMDDTMRRGIGLLPVMQKTIAEQDKRLVELLYKDQERFGVAWLPAGAGSKLRAAGKTEIYSAELPFVLPDNTVLKAGKAGGDEINTNHPDVAQELVGQALTDAGIAVPDSIGAGTAVASAEGAGGGPLLPGVSKTPGRIEKPILSNGQDPEPPAATGAGEPAAVTPQPATPTFGGDTERIEAMVTVRGAAFCVAPGVVVTTAHIVQGATIIRITAPDADPVDGEVVSIDEATGLALVRTSARLSPMPLAEVSKSGKATIACFAKASLFGPELDMLRGDLTVGGGKASFRMSTHPRSAGAPILNEDGQVIGVLSAGRDDAVANLAVIPVEAVRKLLGQPLPVATAPQPDQAVAEIMAMKKVD